MEVLCQNQLTCYNVTILIIHIPQPDFDPLSPFIFTATMNAALWCNGRVKSRASSSFFWIIDGASQELGRLLDVRQQQGRWSISCLSPRFLFKFIGRQETLKWIKLWFTTLAIASSEILNQDFKIGILRLEMKVLGLIFTPSCFFSFGILLGAWL